MGTTLIGNSTALRSGKIAIGSGLEIPMTRTVATDYPDLNMDRREKARAGRTGFPIRLLPGLC